MKTINQPITVATFYKFTPLQNPGLIQARLREVGQEKGMKGSILLAHEGINATLAAPHQVMMDMLAYIQSLPEIGPLPYQLSEAEGSPDKTPFRRYFVKVKPEIVSLGRPDINPANKTGTYVDPKQWNDLLNDPEVLVIDVRNDYEIDMGTFKGAINPHTAVFKEFPEYIERELDPKQHKKIAMCCTGGIRCEKASALMLEQGFEEVYHLKGGILHYVTTVSPEESLWKGDCFVFDDRITL